MHLFFLLVYVLSSGEPVHQCGLPPVRCGIKHSPFLWENNITATAAGKVWRMAHRDVSEPGFSARHDHKQFLVFHHVICFIKSEWHLNSQTGDLATDNMHAGRSGCVDLTTFKQSKWDDRFRWNMRTRRGAGGGHVSWGRAWRDSHLTDFFCFKGVCGRQLTVRICI